MCITSKRFKLNKLLEKMFDLTSFHLPYRCKSEGLYQSYYNRNTTIAIKINLTVSLQSQMIRDFIIRRTTTHVSDVQDKK